LGQHEPRTLELPPHYTQTPIPVNPPVVSIVTPSFNQGFFLEETLASVLRQDYPRLEYIVQDGGSTDETLAILKRQGAALKHWESGPDLGQAHAINLGFRHTSGEIMAYLNSDDLLLPGCLAYVAAYFAEHPEVDVVYGHRILIDEDGAEVGRWILPPHDDEVLSWADFIPQETMFWRRRIWDRVGGCFDQSFQFTLDWDLLLRFQKAGARFTRLPRFLGAFRLHGSQKTQQNRYSVGEREMDRLRRRCHGRDVSRAEIRSHIKGFLLKHSVYRWLYDFGFLRY
jgi:glycosyltransferase involved in cell wall biosynthesis